MIDQETMRCPECDGRYCFGPECDMKPGTVWVVGMGWRPVAIAQDLESTMGKSVQWDSLVTA